MNAKASKIKNGLKLLVTHNYARPCTIQKKRDKVSSNYAMLARIDRSDK
jgi:hypothetical protein